MAAYFNLILAQCRQQAPCLSSHTRRSAGCGPKEHMLPGYAYNGQRAPSLRQAGGGESPERHPAKGPQRCTHQLPAGLKRHRCAAYWGGRAVASAEAASRLMLGPLLLIAICHTNQTVS
jgi:hypothetical protein